MVVPCYMKFGMDEDEKKIFGFDWKSGKLVREIGNDELNKEGWYIG